MVQIVASRSENYINNNTSFIVQRIIDLKVLLVAMIDNIAGTLLLMWYIFHTSFGGGSARTQHDTKIIERHECGN